MHGNNPTNDMDFAAFHSFWETAINIASFTATPAVQHSYNMNAVEDDATAASLTGTVSNFGAAYAATQESLRNNNASINAAQGQIQMLYNAIGEPAPCRHASIPTANQPGLSSMRRLVWPTTKQGQQGQPSGGGGGTNNGSG
jgi:hypothetical protein